MSPHGNELDASPSAREPLETPNLQEDKEHDQQPLEDREDDQEEKELAQDENEDAREESEDAREEGEDAREEQEDDGEDKEEALEEQGDNQDDAHASLRKTHLYIHTWTHKHTQLPLTPMLIRTHIYMLVPMLTKCHC